MTEAAHTWREHVAAYLVSQANPPHKYGHQPRLYHLARQIAEGSPELVWDDDVVYAAAFLHDLGVFVGHRPEDPDALRQWDHVAYTCDRIPALLTQFRFPAEKIASVLTVVREHQPHDQPSTMESTLVRDADILEQLGAVAILRTASKLGSDTRFLHFEDARRSLQQALNTLPGALRLPAARLLAESRTATMRAFLEALDMEAGAHLG